MIDTSMRRNLLINFAGLILPTFVSLVTVPLYIKALGLDRFGVITLVWVLVGYFAVMDFGISLASENRISRALAAGDADEVSRTFWSACWFNLATGCAGGAALWASAGAYFNWGTQVPPALLGEVAAALPWVALSIPVGNLSLVFAGSISAAERFSVFNTNQTIGTVLFQVLPVVMAFTLAPTLQVAIMASVAARIVASLMLGAATWRVLGLTRMAPPERACMRELFAYGRWLQLAVVANMIGDSLDRLVVGAMQTPRFVTYYAVPQNLVSRLNLLAGALSRTLFPRLSAARPEQARETAYHSLMFLNNLFTPVAIGAMFTLGPFLHVWIRQELSPAAAEVGRIMIVAVWLAGQTTVARVLMLAQNRQAAVAHVSMLQLPVFALLLWLLVSRFGILGAGTAVLARGTIDYAASLVLSRMPVRAALREMLPHLMFIIVALAVSSAQAPLLIAWTLGAGLVAANLAWSLHSSASFRDAAAVVWQRVGLGRG
ncbi:oligosaccharide flippase family protein [Cupriavidus basilensis]|uniref:Oligosaccharide flippase family protein n=1 Tax=Cupriavidus basilensis TaxID=68895 RepID=A0ABT6B3M8_9BURK|nr:oligosaccharide flippase family protein [Cupriavidus basilensis]MDF3839480.1 oligosaccharide flippase family protein [Cupriavidus basilensis]